MSMKIALCVIATGKYTQFLCELIATAGKHFCLAHDVRLHAFTDTAMVPNHPGLQAFVTPTAHESWPGPTLHRYRTILRREATRRVRLCLLSRRRQSLRAPVGDEILGDLVAVVHFGFAGRPSRDWTYEGRYASRACIPPECRDIARHYYAGGFQGGRAAVYLDAMRAMAAAIDDDEAAASQPAGTTSRTGTAT